MFIRLGLKPIRSWGCGGVGYMELQGLNANRCSIGQHFYTTTLRKLYLKQGEDQVKQQILILGAAVREQVGAALHE